MGNTQAAVRYDEAEAGLDADEQLDAGEISGLLGFRIRLAHGTVYRNFMDTFSHLDLTQKQVGVMWLINDLPGIAQTELAQRLRMDRATTMAIVNRLQGRGYLQRGKSDVDGRKQTLTLLPAGQKILVEAKAAVCQHEAWLKSRFKPKEIEKLLELLSRIHG